MTRKFCFMNAQRPCDLTCKAAFEVDDPVDNIDCYFIWLAFHFGEGFDEIRKSLEGGGGAGPGAPSGPTGPSMPPMPPGGPKFPKGFSGN
ncbi:MAG: hypothetical protein IT453_04440 [Planctomycetes bacterium]|nr:hypothetical protein [Planctomycetota bacterium]